MENINHFLIKTHDTIQLNAAYKLMPNIRIFLDEKMTSLAVLLDQELRRGWSDSHEEQILLLKREIVTIQEEAIDLQQRLV